MAKTARKRTIVGSPLTPDMLKELGAVRGFPPLPGDFAPDTDWEHTYRIWTCHGYRESGNENVGYLRIRRTADSGDHFALNVYRKVVQMDALVNIVEAKVKCRKNPLASPAAWELKSRFVDVNNNELPQLRSSKKGLFTTVGDVTGDWCLFEAVQRLAFDRQTTLGFGLLEGLNVWKSDQHLFYRGAYPTEILGADRLHCFVQLGGGILPTEYWLDDRHRLLAIISMNKAYIFDAESENMIEQQIEYVRRSYQKSKGSKRK